jgi:SAM-dependent methyltransferase
VKKLAGQIGPLVVVDSPQQENSLLRRHIEAKGASGQELAILEAGCGNSWQLELPGVRFTLTGVDLDEEALNIRKFQRRDLQEAILGDLRTVSLEENKYDVIYNSFVLEHVQDVEQVLDNFHRWLSPGGILILRIPDRRSVYGFLTRVTPFWFHVFYKRYIGGNKMAGKPGYDPFPTVYEPIVSRAGLHHWCAARGMTIQEEVGWNFPVGRPGLVALAIKGAIKAFSLLSLGRLAADHVNLTYVMEKPAAETTPISASGSTVHSQVNS